MDQIFTPTNLTLIGAMVVVIIGICEGLKSAGIPTRFIPLISVFLGTGFSYFTHGIDFISTLSGVILGLGTTGGYRVVKTSLLNR